MPNRRMLESWVAVINHTPRSRASIELYQADSEDMIHILDLQISWILKHHTLSVNHPHITVIILI